MKGLASAGVNPLLVSDLCSWCCNRPAGDSGVTGSFPSRCLPPVDRGLSCRSQRREPGLGGPRGLHAPRSAAARPCPELLPRQRRHHPGERQRHPPGPAEHHLTLHPQLFFTRCFSNAWSPLVWPCHSPRLSNTHVWSIFLRRRDSAGSAQPGEEQAERGSQWL